MASISSTNSVGNTSLRGYGGMASGIDRDAIIEQMTLGTTTKINNQEKAITKLEWKQEAYRSISDKILGMSDDYFSYTAMNSLKDPNTFAKNLINILGKEDSTRFVTASGASDLVDNVSIQAVRRLASASVSMSATRPGQTLNIKMEDLGGRTASYSNLMGAELRFGHAETVIPLFALMRLPGCYVPDASAGEVAARWCDRDVSPLGANLMMVVLKARSGEDYAALRLNGKWISIGNKKLMPWPELRSLWESYMRD